MVPLSEMRRATAFHKACDRGMPSPRQMIDKEITHRQRELKAAREEIVIALQERAHQVVDIIQGLAQEVMASDPTSASRDQVDNLEHSVRDLKQTRERTMVILDKANTHLSVVTARYQDLKKELVTLQRTLKEKQQHDPFFNFIEEGGKRACEAISESRRS